MEPIITRGSLRAYRQAVNPYTVYVRDEAGPLDLTGVTTLQAAILNRATGSCGCDYPNGPSADLLIDATSPEAGQVRFTITAAQANRLASAPTLFLRADDQTIYTALLEVVG